MELRERVAEAVKAFWRLRVVNTQGGKTMTALIDLTKAVLCENGCAENEVVTGSRLELPGYFRPAKQWDLIVLREGRLIAAIEFKSQIGSLGNNVNNRAEEAIGNGVDLLKAFDHGLIHEGPPRPWIGYVFLLEDCDEARSVVRVRTPHFPVDPVFANASYQRRYELLCERLVGDGIYQAACFLMSGHDRGPGGHYLQPNSALTYEAFMTALLKQTRPRS